MVRPAEGGPAPGPERMVVTFPIDVPDSWAGHEHYARRVLWRLARQPSLPTLYFQGRWLNGATLADAVRATAVGLRRAGLTPGGTVAVLTEPNHPAMLIGRYAAHLLGAAVVQVRSANPRSDAFPLPAATQARILDETGTSVILVDAPIWTAPAPCCHAAGGGPRLLGYGVGAADCPDALSYRDEPLGELPAHSPDRRALVAFTSGSGGTPKSIHQTFGVWDSTVRSAASGEPEERRVFLAVTPLSHTIGAMADAVLAAAWPGPPASGLRRPESAAGLRGPRRHRHLSGRSAPVPAHGTAGKHTGPRAGPRPGHRRGRPVVAAPRRLQRHPRRAAPDRRGPAGVRPGARPAVRHHRGRMASAI